MLLQGCLYICRVYSAVVQIDQAAETRQNEAMIVRLGRHRVVNEVDKLEAGKLAQACDLCQGPDLVAPCSGYLHPAFVRFHVRSQCGRGCRQLATMLMALQIMQHLKTASTQTDELSHD